MTRVAAVDLGASSVRVAVIDLEAHRPEVEIVHRFRHEAESHPDGSVRWDWGALVNAVVRGLDLAIEKGPLASIAVDGWAVDYGLLDADGALLSTPHSYRSPRTQGWRSVANRLGETALYRRTGIQLMPINTIFQLAAHDRAELARAHRLVMLPELMTQVLAGEVSSESTNATTTGLVDLATEDWARDIADDIGVDPSILPTIEPGGRCVGRHRGVPVHLVATHDTACAVAALPLGPSSVFIASGSWFLVGTERDRADVSDAARRSNFSNELGATGGRRFLKNVPGLWLLERCAATWGVDMTSLRNALEAVPAEAIVAFDIFDERLAGAAPVDDIVRVAAGLDGTASQAVIARVLVESVALGVAAVVDELRAFGPVEELVIGGGGAAWPFLHSLLAQHVGLDVVRGPVEATALGNAVLQGVALGRFANLGEARGWIAGEPTTRARPNST